MRRALYVVAVVVLAACSGGDSSQPAPSGGDAAGQAAAPAEQAPPPRKTLPDADEVPGVEIDTSKLQKIDLAQLQSNGTLQIEVNDPAMTAHVGNVLDGDTTTLARTLQINPLIVTFTFDQPVSVKAVRLFPTYSSYDWVLEAVPGKDRLLIRDAPHNGWSGLSLDAPTETSIIRIELLRLERDDNVHLNEIEIYG